MQSEFVEDRCGNGDDLAIESIVITVRGEA